MSVTTAGKNKMLDALGATHKSLHTAYPGDTGLNEITTAPYARKAITWSAAAAGNLDSADAPAFDIPAGVPFAWCGSWDALTLGTCLEIAPLGASPIDYTVDNGADAINATAHGYADNNIVAFWEGAVPGGLVEGTLYYVVSATANTFQVSATQGGAAIVLTDTVNAAKMSKVAAEGAYGSNGTYTLNDADIGIS